MALVLTACGGGGDSGTSAVEASKFTKSATWTFQLPVAGNSLCFDFDNNLQTVDCTGTAWDIKAVSGGRSVTFATNSGGSGSGTGAALFGLMAWDYLQQWKSATVAPDDASKTNLSAQYTADSSSNIISQKSWYAYGLKGDGDHLLYPNYRVYLVTRNSADATAVSTGTAPVFAFQVIGYYGGAGGTTSGYPKIRWIDRQTPGDVRTQQINAVDSTVWTYFDLKNGAVVSLSDADAANSGAWDIAFRRDKIKFNGGISGTGKVAGFLGKTPSGFYDADGNPVKSQFTDSNNEANTLADLNAADMQAPASASAWVKDSNSSLLSPAYTGTYPGDLDYGWFIYHPSKGATANEPANRVSANEAKGALIRSGTGNSYARAHLTSIVYVDPSSATSQQTWTLKFDVQPATSSP